MGKYWLRSLALFFAFAVVTAACGDSDSDSSSGSEESSSAEAEEAAVEEADPVVAAAKAAVLEYEAAGLNRDNLPTSSPTPEPGKLIGIIPCLEASACGFFADVSEEAAEAAGWEVLRIDGKGNAADQANAVRQMIAAGVDGIVLHVVPPEAIPEAIKEGKEAGIAFVGFAVIDPDDLIDHRLPSADQWTKNGEMAGDYIIAETDGKAKVLAFVSGDLPNNFLIDNEVVRRLEACRDCEVIVREEFLLTDLQTRNPEAIASAARAHPEADVVYVAFDAALFFAIPELEKLGRGADLFAVAHDANPENQELIRTGRVHRASTTYDYALAGWEAIDAMNRIFAGEDPMDSRAMGTTLRLITPNNVPDEGVPVYGLDYREFYTSLWGK